MKRIALVALSTVSLLAFMTVPATAAQPLWDMTGTYTIHYLCTSGCSGEYDHMDSITVTNMADPETFTGTGYYVANPAYTENISGTLTGANLSFYVDYTGLNPGYYMNVVGTVAGDGSMSGTATAPGQTFTWTATGKARPFGYTTAAGCAAGEAFVSATGTEVNFVTTPGHKYRLTARGTYYAGGSGLYDIRADAEYSQDRWQFANDVAWTNDVHGYTSYGDILLDLMVDGQNIDWGAFDATHTYTEDMVAGSSATSIALKINDISYAYSNNTGGLCVSMMDLGNVGTFSGFFSPINNGVVNVAKAGQTIPVKWLVLDFNGDPVSDPSHFVGLTSAPSAEVCGGGLSDGIETYAGDSGLQYLGDGYWQYNWKTPKAYAGVCRTMTLELVGPNSFTAEFLFK